MKNWITLVIAVCFASISFAQKVNEANVESPKGKQNGLEITLEGQVKNVEEVLDQKFKSLKGGKNEKGFRVFYGQVFPAISSDMLDYYYRADKNGDNKTTITFLISKGYDNFLSSQTNPSEIKEAKKMLEDMVAEVRRYELQIAIDAQTKVYEKAIKEQEKLVKDGEGLVKDQKKLEDDLAKNKKDQEQNKKDQENQKNAIAGEKKLLDDLQKKLSEVK